MTDAIRKSLVTQFVCAACGDYLTLSYETPKKRDNALHGEDYNMTGAAKVHTVVAVHHCERCYSKATEPINALRRVLAEVSKPEGINNDLRG